MVVKIPISWLATAALPKKYIQAGVRFFDLPLS
jgi:hypothetical protein